jgi:hypothetical protein
MAWATVADLRSLVRTVESDEQVASILNTAQNDIEGTVGEQTGVVSASLSRAHLYLSAVFLLRFMQTNGEMAYYNKVGPDQTYNQIEPAIADFENRYRKAMRQVSTGALYAIVKSTGEV